MNNDIHMHVFYLFFGGWGGGGGGIRKVRALVLVDLISATSSWHCNVVYSLKNDIFDYFKSPCRRYQSD